MGLDDSSCDWCGRKFDKHHKLDGGYYCSPKCMHEAEEADAVPRKGVYDVIVESIWIYPFATFIYALCFVERYVVCAIIMSVIMPSIIGVYLSQNGGDRPYSDVGIEGMRRLKIGAMTAVTVVSTLLAPIIAASLEGVEFWFGYCGVAVASGLVTMAWALNVYKDEG